jgi:hypothetical protein
MSRKTKESPLNLIRILPPKEGASPSKKFNPASTHFKLKLDGKDASRSMLSLGGLVGIFDTMFRGIGKIGPWTLHQVRRLLDWFAQGILQIGQVAQFLSGKFMKSARRLSGEMQSSGKQGWSELSQGKKSPVSESIQKEKSKQRETLIEEVHALRTQLTTHQDELIRVTAQMEELKALVSSQQQVLLHLGKELEATERNEIPSERLTIRKTNPRGSKPSKSDKSESPESLPPTQFEFGPPHH